MNPIYPAFFRRFVPAVLIGIAIAIPGPSRAAAQESCYNGAFPGFSGSLSNVIDFEQQSGKGLAIANFFKNWEDPNGSIGFPTSTMTGLRNHGSIPLLSWQPQGHRPDSHYALANIINGNFDTFITNYALAAKAWGHPFFLRFAHEMNGNWYPWCESVNGNTSGQYVAAWRHVRDIFTRNGVTNVTWVWCPNTKYSSAVPIPGLYPGDNYVDWISTDVYNRIANAWGHFSVRGGPTLDEITALAPGKPIMIAETGCHRDEDEAGTPPGSKAQWYRTAMKNELKFIYPRIKAWVYFNGNNPDGNNWRIDTSTDVLAAYQESVGLSYYSDNKYGSITESPVRPLLNDATSTDTMDPFVSIDLPRVNKVQAGVTHEIYTSASDKSGIVKVEYSVNGVLQHTENQSPYQYFWPVPSGAGASYAIVCKAFDGEGNTALSTVNLVSVDPPAAPTGIAASDGSHTDKVRVTWSAVASAYAYEVWRNTSDTTTGAINLTAQPVAGTSFDDTTAAYGTTYHYWLKAVDDAGVGAFSVSDSGFRSLPAPPVAPAGLYATDGIYNDYTLVAWNNMSGTAGYEVWRNTVNNSATAVKIATVTQNSYQDAEVPYGINHFYWAKAFNDGGTSGFSNVGAGYTGNLPTISDIANRTINQLADTGAIAFTVDDVETAAADLILSATSSNTALVPVENIVFGGSGTNRSVIITPAAGQAGTTTITLTVTDGNGGQRGDSFVLTVNALPVISPLGDLVISTDTGTGAIAFTVSDAETAAGSLTVSGGSSNTALVPVSNIVFGGSGTNRTVTVTPAAGIAGTTEISVTVGDGTGSAVESFFLSVIDASQALWTATTTGAPLAWSTGGNWLTGLPPQGGNVTSLTFLSGVTLPAGEVITNNDIAAPFALNSLNLSGTGPTGAAGTVILTGGAIQLVNSAGGDPPAIHLAASDLLYRVGMPLALAATTTIDGGGSAVFAIDGDITGAAGITKSGSATLVLGGNNSYTGRTIISGGNGGILRVTSPTGLGSNGALQVNTGAVSPLIQLHIDGSGSDGIIPMSNGFGGNSHITTTIDVGNNGSGNTGNIIQLNGYTTGWGNNATLNVTGSNNYGLHMAQLRSTGGAAGAETLNPTTAPLTIGTYLGADNATTLTLAGTHSGNAITGAIANGASQVSLIKSGASTWVLGGNNSFSGFTSIQAGRLVIGHGNGLGSGAGATTILNTGSLALRGGISVAEAIGINGRSAGDQLINESGNNTLGAAISLNTGGNAYFLRSDSGRLTFSNTLTMLGSTATKTLHFTGEGDITVLGTIGAESGVLGIMKSGGGTLTLAGTHSYTGETRVDGGTLIADGNLDATSAVIVSPTATLSGEGTIAGVTSIAGTHAPGAGIGGQNFGAALSYNSTSHLEWQLADAGHDTVAAQNVMIEPGATFDIELDGTIDFTGPSWSEPRSWAILSADAIDGAFTLGEVSDVSAADFGSFSLETVGSTLHVVWTPDDPFAAWQDLWFGEDANDPAISGETIDHDHDGLANLIEYALGTDPTEASASGIDCEVDGDSFAMVYRLSKTATDISVEPEWSIDLETWNPTGIAKEVVSDDGDLLTIRAAISMSDEPRIAMRLRITQP